MPGQSYNRPPVTEAMIELRFANLIGPNDLEKTRRRFLPSYPQYQHIRNVGIEINIPVVPDDSPQARANQEFSHRLTSQDATEIIVLQPSSIAVAQLAPYPGWEIFFPRFVRDWEAWKREVGYLRIIRVGVRFINRIDIPTTNGRIEEDQYLSVYPKLPDGFGPVTGYGIQAQLPMLDVGCNLTINSAAVPSPMLGHGSVLLDLDISMEVNVPQKDSDIYELLNRIRIKKNETFEACVTAQAKALFR